MPRRPVARDYGSAGHPPGRPGVPLVLPAILLTALAGLSACAVGPSQRPEVAVRDGAASNPPAGSSTGTPPLPPLDKPESPTLRWTTCADTTRAQLGAAAPAQTVELTCAQLTGVLDSPARPGRGSIQIALLKAGSGPVPLVVVNDASGEPGSLFAARLAAQLPPELLTTFSLIGVDRRGTGASNPVECVPPEVRASVLGFDPATATLDPVLEGARKASQECVLDLDDKLSALDTWRTASDLEKLRSQLGVPRLNAVGRGEGSRVLTTYADRYPTRLGRIVLDGALDPTLDGIGQAEAHTVGAEQALQLFAADCVSKGCPLGQDPQETLSQLVEQLRERPLTAGEVLVGPGMALNAVLEGLADRTRWPTLADAVAKAKAGDGTGLATFTLPLLNRSNELPARFDLALVTGCNDMTLRITPERATATANDWRSKHPLFGALFADQLLLCSPWPVPHQALPTPRGAGAPPILVLSTAGDPVTPQQGTERTSRQLDSGVLVGWQGGGHGALTQSTCATATVQQFLVEGKVPADGTVCPP